MNIAAKTLALIAAGALSMPAGAGPASPRTMDAAFAVARIALPGAGRGDYITVDRDHGRLFVTHTDAVHILDLDSLKPLATLTNLTNAHGVVVDPASGRLLAFDGVGHAVSVIDPARAAVVAAIALPGSPEFAVADGKGMVWVNISDRSAIVAIDTRTLRVVRTTRLAACEDTTPLAFDAASACCSRVAATGS